MKNVIAFMILMSLGCAALAGDINHPIAYWNFDEGSGLIANDTANGNDGTLISGPVWTEGKFNGGLQFNGTNYVDCGNNTSLNITGSISISAWVKFDTLSNFQTFVAKRGDSFDQVYGSYGFRTGYSPYTDELEFYYNSPYSSGWHDWDIYRTTNANLVPGQWYNFVVTYTFGTSSSIKCYVNSNLQTGLWTAGTGNSPVITNNTRPVTIGGLPNDERVKGLMDDVRIYNYALNANEVAELYTIPEPATMILVAGGIAFLRKRVG